MFSKFKKVFGTSREERLKKCLKKFCNENHDQYLNKKQFETILKNYEEWIKCKDVNNILEKQVLCNLFIRAFKSNINDSCYIAKLLVYLYRRAGMHFISFYFNGRFQEIFSSKDHASFAEYILRHATRCRLVINGMRITDLLINKTHPCEKALALGSQELLLVFLRYGALTTGASIKVHMGKILNEILRILVELNPPGISNSDCKKEKLSDSIVFMGKIIMQVCPQLTEDHVLLEENCGRVSSENSDSESMDSDDLDSMSKWFDYNLPEFESNVYQPITLKHICRLKIREVLHEKWLLPDGISRLPLPEPLKMYLNLCY